MYLDYFGFDESPFSITPDPKFVFLSKKHEESLAHLVYGITRGGGAGFVQLTGEVGTGKTTISRLLLEQIPDKTNIALILNPTVTPLELVQNICKELKVSMRGIKTKLNALVDKLNNYLLRSWSDGENTVVIIDEAQNLPRDTLEQLRLLTNLETDKHKLLQIILIGQPELRSTMRRNDLRQLAQRVTARYHLMPLSSDETYDYIQYRIKMAGGQSNYLSPSTSKKAYQLTQGVPRLINILIDRAFLAAYSDDSKHVAKKHLTIAANEVLPEKRGAQIPLTNYLSTKSAWPLYAAILIIGALLYQVYQLENTNKTEMGTGELQSEIKTTSKNPTFIAAKSSISWQYYFNLWDTQTDKNWHKNQCPNSVDTGMACMQHQGNLAQIELRNHPVILQLNNQNLVLLKSIEGNKLVLLNNQNEFTQVTKSWLDQQWLGTYYILWPMPAELLEQPSTAQLNAWALEMANTIAQGEVPKSQLELWVKDFQSNNHLQADGIIGSETQMVLSLMAYNGPTLK